MRLGLGLAILLAVACETMDPSAPGNLVPPTVVEDANLPAIALNGTRFHVQTAGDPARPVVVFLHGGPGGDFRSLLRLGERFQGYALTDEYFLVYWDQRGAGLSQRHSKNALTLDLYTQDVDAIVEHFSPGRPVILIGESWGGMLATQYINTHPTRVAGAVLIEPGPLDGATYERLEDDLFDLDLGKEWLNDYAWNTQFLSPDDHVRMDYELMLGVRDGQPRFHQRNDVNPSPIWRLGAVVNRYLLEDGQDANGVSIYDFTQQLSQFTTPVLFIAGGLSEVLGPSLQQEQIHQYPTATLEVVSGAGHDVAWTNTPEVLAHVRAYLDALKGASR
jgi:proline iminopeptidase